MRQLGIFYCLSSVLYILHCWISFTVAVRTVSDKRTNAANDGFIKRINGIVQANNRLLKRREINAYLLALNLYENLLVEFDTNKTVFISDITEDNPKLRAFQLNLQQGGALTQFKLLKRDVAFVSYEENCWICELEEGNCCKLLNVTKPSIPEAVFTSNGSLVIHVDSNDYKKSAGIFNLGSNFFYKSCAIQLQQYVPDLNDDKVSSISTGFNRKGFTYFVSTVKRADMELLQDMLNCGESCIQNTIRITRICDRDQTKELLSRIDIPLHCDGLFKNGNFTYKAGAYNAHTDTLLTAVEDSNNFTVICKFDMKKVSKEFDQIWKTCQQKETIELANWQLNGSAVTHFPAAGDKPCSKYGRDQRTYSNCDLHEYSGFDSRNGWLESFSPLNGTLFTRLPTNGEDFSIQQVHGDEAVLAYIGANNSVARVLSSGLLWSMKLNTDNHLQFAADSDSGLFFHAENRKAKRMKLSCKTLYGKCNDLQRIAWSDPLDCQWCQLDGAIGFAYSYTSESCGGTRHINECDISINSNSVRVEPDSYLDIGFSGSLGSEKADTVLKPTRMKTRTMRAILGIVCAVIFATLICLIVWFFYRYSKKNSLGWQSAIETGFDTPYKLSYRSNMCGKSNDYRANSNYERLFAKIKPTLQIEFEKIQLGEKIGEGHFGVVYKATYDGSNGPQEVACKTINTFDDSDHNKAVAEFLQEGLIMARLSHPHVLRLIGISLTPCILPVIVSDYMPNGNLLQYISNSSNKFTYGDLIHFATQIASGMEYIHSMNYIHRDLAARNCMLDLSFDIKISDFGLTRQISATGAYQVRNESRKIPFRWLPPESLNRGEFTKEGDVWAFGVVLWEMATRGCVPYGAYTDIKSTMSYLADGSRLEQPKGCPKILYNDMMMKCWDAIPSGRPSFAKLIGLLQKAQRDLEEGVENGTTSS